MNVLVDIGNTRIKWALARGRRLEATGQAVHAGALSRAVESLSAALPERVDRVIVANVAGEEVAQAVRARLGAARGVEPQFAAAAREHGGVRCAYAEPARLGVDRWAAMIAAHDLVSGAAVGVVDAGTTVTFDALDAAGMHLGGLILAGPGMATEALKHGTERVRVRFDVARRPAGLDVLGRTTAEAVAHGVMLGLSGAVDRAARIVAEALGTAPALLITGGDGLALASWLETQAQYRADLVLEGLALLAATGGASRDA